MKHVNQPEVRYIASHEKDDLVSLNVSTIGFESIPVHADYPASGHPQGYSFNFGRGRVLQEFQLLYITRGKGQFASKSTTDCCGIAFVPLIRSTVPLRSL